MIRRAPTVQMSLLLLVAGSLAATLVFFNNSWPFYTVAEIWVKLEAFWRLIVMICLLAAGFGLGGLVNALVRRGRTG